MPLGFLVNTKKKAPAAGSGTVFDDVLASYEKLDDKSTFLVQNAPVTPGQLKKLSLLIKTRKELSKVSLIGCRLNNASSLVDFLQAVKASKSITALDLSSNDFGDEGMKLIAEVVQLRHNIVEVSVSNCSITKRSCNAIKTMLQYNKKVRCLDIGDNAIGTEGVGLICQGILDSPLGDRSDIEEMDLSQCQIGDEGCKIIGSVLASCPNLRKISLRDNMIRSNGSKAISHGLNKKTSGNEGLSLIDLSGNEIGDSGAALLAQKLAKAGTVETLLLNRVGMTEKGIKSISEAVVKSDCVAELGLGGNSLSDGASIVLPVIQLVANTSSLKTLDLSKMKMSLEDFKTLSEFLGNTTNCGLKKLCLSETNLTNEAAVHVARALETNHILSELDVTSNPFGAKGAKAFARTFRRAKTLKVFRVTGQSRIGAEGENYLAESLRFNKTVDIKGSSRELDYMTSFAKNGGAFKWSDDKQTILDWSSDSWEVVKRGSGMIIATAILNLSKDQLKQFKNDVLRKKRNVVNQDMFEYVIRHCEAPALDVVAVFVNKLGITLDTPCGSKASVAMSGEKAKSDDVTYRFVAKDCAKDPMVRAMAANSRLFLGRYITEFGPAVHETHEVTRLLCKDTMATGVDKDKKVFVQIFENGKDFETECIAREQMKEQLKGAGPFALYDTILKEVEVHEDNNTVSYLSNITDLRHCINNLGVTSGYNLHETIFLIKRMAQCLGTINNLGRIHGDFRPRNFLKVAHKRMGTDPVGRTGKKVNLPDKWVIFDLSKSFAHGEKAWLRMDSSYVPPEVARVMFHSDYSKKQAPIATEKMDVWSFGVVLFQLLTGTHLFHIETNTDRIYKSKERLELMNWINLDEKRQNMILHRCNESIFLNETTYTRMKSAAVDLVNWCLQGDPHNRPSFNDILSHPFFTYRTNVNYTDVDLLLGWYKRIGSDISVAAHKNNRTHAHVINTRSAACSDVYSVLKLYFSKVGCKITSDADDWKIDVSKRREKAQKARCLIVLLEKGVLLRKEIVQKILWSMDSLETTSLILVDVSTAFTNAAKFDIKTYLTDLESDEGKKQIEDLAKSLCPIQEKLDLKQVKYEKNESHQKKWLQSYLFEKYSEVILSLQDKIMPYRTRPFQTQAMVDEILHRAGFVNLRHLRKFKLCQNLKSMEEIQESESKRKSKFNVLVLYNGATTQVPEEKLRSDAELLQKQLISMETSDSKPNITLVDSPADVFKHFSMSTDQGLRMLTADQPTVVLCLVSQGFYEVFREQMLLLDSAKGLLSVVPISYDYFDVTKGIGKEEVLNLGLENKEVMGRLKDNRSYIPLPKMQETLKYETEAAMAYIEQEAQKAIELAKVNQSKSESELYARYTHSNFFESVY